MLKQGDQLLENVQCGFLLWLGCTAHAKVFYHPGHTSGNYGPDNGALHMMVDSGFPGQGNQSKLVGFALLQNQSPNMNIYVW